MAVIWGLDLKEMQWSKFGNSYMWNNEYHRRRTKFIVYQIAMIFCVVSESLGTAALSDYVDQENYVKAADPGATVHNNNFIGIASYNIFVGVYVATIFGSAFFFDLFWPERHESKGVKLAWRICSVLACLFTLSCALAFTEIVAQRSAHVSGEPLSAAVQALKEYGGSPLKYRHNGRAIASVVFLWPGTIATFASTYLLWHSIAHIDAYGPFSTHARAQNELPKTASENEKPRTPMSDRSFRGDHRGGHIASPQQAHHQPEGFRNSSIDQQRVDAQYGPV